jgi:hypothetical protein
MVENQTITNVIYHAMVMIKFQLNSITRSSNGKFAPLRIRRNCCFESNCRISCITIQPKGRKQGCPYNNVSVVISSKRIHCNTHNTLINVYLSGWTCAKCICLKCSKTLLQLLVQASTVQLKWQCSNIQTSGFSSTVSNFIVIDSSNHVTWH